MPSPARRWRSGRWLLALFCLTAAGPAAAESGCLSPATQTIALRHVHDGDTVTRADGESLRLIGIDTPELARDDRPAEAGARRARERLRVIIANADTLHVRYGDERRDHYGRLLGHLYADGVNIQAELLRAGLATPLTIAPNLGHRDCYRAATRQAREQRRGLWALPAYQPQPAAALPADTRGYRVVTGTVQRVGHSRCCIWLNLTEDVALRIARDDSDRFRITDWDALVGQRLEARGKFYRRSGQLRLTLSHPDAWTLY